MGCKKAIDCANNTEKNDAYLACYDCCHNYDDLFEPNKKSALDKVKPLLNSPDVKIAQLQQEIILLKDKLFRQEQHHNKEVVFLIKKIEKKLSLL